MNNISVCPYCNGYETTAGFQHSAGCPANKSDTTYYTVPLVDLQSEIARLKAAIEQDEKEIVAEHKRYRDMVEQRDEARRLARRYYREYQAAVRYFDNLFDDGNKWDGA